VAEQTNEALRERSWLFLLVEACSNAVVWSGFGTVMSHFGAL
jgi:hypothetical protein